MTARARICFVGALPRRPNRVWAGSWASSYSYQEAFRDDPEFEVVLVDRAIPVEELARLEHGFDLVHVDDSSTLQRCFERGLRVDVVGPLARAPDTVKSYGSPPWRSVYTEDWFYRRRVLRLNGSEERRLVGEQSPLLGAVRYVSMGVPTHTLRPAEGERRHLVLWAGDRRRHAKNHALYRQIVERTILPSPYRFIELSGFVVSDYWRLLDRTALVVNTSLWETFCHALFEARAKGVPTVYRRGLHGDRFADGRIQVDYDVESYRRAILDLLADPDRLAREGEEARRYAVDAASLRVMRDSYAGAYQELLDGPRR